MSMAYWGNDTYASGEVIIPPKSIIDGTAPAGAFIAYINSVNITKIRTCDYVLILQWTKAMMDAIPEDTRAKLYEESGKDE